MIAEGNPEMEESVITMREDIGKQVGKTKQTFFKTVRKVCNLWRENRDTVMR